jgi:hypothetical protein
MGTWTAHAGAEPDTAAGGWKLLNNDGGVQSSGTWSLRKLGGQWHGSWSARLPDDRIISGEWTANTKLDPSASFLDLMGTAVSDVVSGTWQSGRQSGAWSIRTRAR